MPTQPPSPRGHLFACALLLCGATAAAEPLPRAAAEAAFVEAVRAAKLARDAPAEARETPDPGLLAAAEQEARAALGEALAAEYRDRHLRLSTRPGAGWTAGRHELCLDLANSGPLAVRALGLGLRLRDYELRQALPVGEFLAEQQGTTDVVIPSSTEGTGPGAGRLAPWRSWRQPESSCLALSPTPEGSEARRLLQRLGGFSRNAADWRLTLGDVFLARPASTEDEPHAVVFQAEIARIEARALGLRPAAPATPPPAADPVLARLQEALTARGFDAGPPDGVAGARTLAAMRRFQEAQGEAVTGSLTEAQQRALLGEAR